MESRRDLFANYRADIAKMNEADILKFRSKRGSSFYNEEEAKIQLLSAEQANIKAINEANSNDEFNPFYFFIKSKKRYYLLVVIIGIVVALGMLAWLVSLLYRRSLV